MEKLKSNKNSLKFFRWMSLFTIMVMVILCSGKIVMADSRYLEDAADKVIKEVSIENQQEMQTEFLEGIEVTEYWENITLSIIYDDDVSSVSKITYFPMPGESPVTGYYGEQYFINCRFQVKNTNGEWEEANDKWNLTDGSSAGKDAQILIEVRNKENGEAKIVSYPVTIKSLLEDAVSWGGEKSNFTTNNWNIFSYQPKEDGIYQIYTGNLDGHTMYLYEKDNLEEPLRKVGWNMEDSNYGVRLTETLSADKQYYILIFNKYMLGNEMTIESSVVSKPDSVSIKTLPNKTRYVIGYHMSAVSTEGMKLTLTYSDKTEREVDSETDDNWETNVEIGDFERDTNGNVKNGIQKIKVSYLGVETEFEINVITMEEAASENPVIQTGKTAIPVVKEKNEYWYMMEISETGEYQIKTKGMSGADAYIELYDQNYEYVDSYIYVDAESEETLQTCLEAKTGEKYYLHVEAYMQEDFVSGSFDFILKKKTEVTGLKIVSLPNKTEYMIGKDEYIDYDGLAVQISYADQTEETLYYEITLWGIYGMSCHADIEYENGAAWKAGTYIVEVKMGEFKDSFKINISSPMDTAKEMKVDEFYVLDKYSGFGPATCVYYKFTPTETKAYEFYTFGDEGLNTNAVISDSNGNSMCIFNPSIGTSGRVVLQAGSTYLLRIDRHDNKEMQIGVSDTLCNCTSDMPPFPAWKAVKKEKATCTNTGIITYMCENCKTEKTGKLNPLGHQSDGEFVIDKQPNCTETGQKSRYCGRCNTVVEKIVIQASGHSFSAIPTVDREPDCLSEGQQSRHCINCSVVTEKTMIPAIGHMYGAFRVVKKATCTENGEKVKECTKCHVTEKQSINPLGHNFGSLTTDKESTCTEKGQVSKHCSRCGLVSEVQETDAVGHSYGEYTTVQEATVLKEGVQERSCGRCGMKEIRKMEKLKAFIKINVKKLPLKVKQSTTAVKVISMGKGDSIKNWKSSNPKVASVTKKGKITAHKAGISKITITLVSGKKAVCVVNVQKKAVKTTKIKINKTSLTLKRGKSYKLEAVLTPLTSKEKVTYITSNKKIATVSKNGLIKAKKKGTATITVKSGKKIAKCKVKVK